MQGVHNSALNHLHNGLQLLHLSTELQESTPVETTMQSKKQEGHRPWVVVVHRELGRIDSRLNDAEVLPHLLAV
jgi:hypothetical protein